MTHEPETTHELARLAAALGFTLEPWQVRVAAAFMDARRRGESLFVSRGRRGGLVQVGQFVARIDPDCPDCHGVGLVGREPCAACAGGRP